MLKIKEENGSNQLLEQRTQNVAQLLLGFRNMQDKKSTEFLKSLGNLSMQELNVLNVIGDHEPCIMSEVAKLASLSMSSISVIVDKLVKRKLVKRVRSSNDRRIVNGVLTTEGKRIHQIQIGHLHDVIRKMLNALTADEQELLMGMFQKMIMSWF